MDYTRGKLKDSMRLALRKRPVSAEAIDQAITRIEEKLLALGEKEIASSQVGELVMRELRKLDKIAYIRFASVYRSFEDVSEFRDVLDEFSPPTPRKG
ncbi:Transcriptional repressor NrdR [compost metagenome]